MVQVEKLSKAYGDRVLFGDGSFHVGKRERCVIVGRNGSGKSTLLKILSGLEEADEGSVHFPKGLRVGSLPQHLHFDQPTVIEEALLGLPEEQRDQQYRVEIILEGLGFAPEELDQPPGSFSGGYQLRIALCKVLVGEPDLLLLDEPTNYLDILAIRWLETFLCAWHGQILFISHDRSFVNTVCTHVIGIKRAAMKKVKGNIEDYNTMIQIDEETHQRTAEKQKKKKEHMLSFVERFGAKATKAAQAQSRMKAVEKMVMLEQLEDEQSLVFRFNYKEIQNRVLIRAENISYSYDDSPLIHDLSFSLERKERLAVIGKNGSGKSTIMRLLQGGLTPKSGKIEIGPNTELAYFGQTNIDRLHVENTIEEELISAFPDAPYGKIRAACGAMLFSGDDAKKSISVLSGGERSRVLLAKILLTPANLLLLDEPTHHLDVESVEALMNAIKLFNGSVVLISHDEDVLNRFEADKLILCHNKRQEFFLGNYRLFLEKKGWEEEVEQVVKKTPNLDRARKKEIEKIERKIERREERRAKLEARLAEEFDQALYEEFEALGEEIEVLYTQLG